MNSTNSDNTIYNYKQTEKEIYNLWLKNNLFSQNQFDKNSSKSPYVVIMPPPNITGRLHMGHALNNTIQDILIRYKRMQGYETKWIPGTDHAGIATQTIVKKELNQEGIDYQELGREKFTDRIWQWKDKYGNIILEQLKRLGISCNWEDAQFTLSPEHCQVVNEAFVELYQKGFIYKGKRIVNWCPLDKTALSDDEIETVDGGEKGFLWHIRYTLAEGNDSLVVATTRPETLFGDVAIGVHPEDTRYKKFIGKKVIVPLQNRKIPIIADEYIDKDFGTGCLKITPAHDPNDFVLGTRHDLPMINVMNEDATMNEVVPKDFQDLSREKCRKKVLEMLTEQQLLVKEEERMVPWGRSYRSGAIIEYRLSDQWFVKMSPLVKDTFSFKDKLNFHPKHWEKVYDYWLNNIQDWCISRQIWWGHRIPAWYCSKKEESEKNSNCHEPVVSLKQPERCPHCQNTNLIQEKDVLDTWFSSALWPMSTLGWLQEGKEKEFENYFPTTTLSTGKDIIFFWVARMVIMSIFFQKKLPFNHVYFHPTVMDAKGKVMSKSKGNGIDPIHIIDGATSEDLKLPIHDAKPKNMKQLMAEVDKKYPDGFVGVGADALRYTLVYLLSSGQELHLSLDYFIDIGRRFTTKLWNVSRLLILSLESLIDEAKSKNNDHTIHLDKIKNIFNQNLSEEIETTHYEDQWIYQRYNSTCVAVQKTLDGFNFSQLGKIYYDFVWHDICDWYVEMIKGRLYDEDLLQRAKTINWFLKILQNTLKLLHPLVPFITESIWQIINDKLQELSIPVDEKEIYLIQTSFPTEQIFEDKKNTLNPKQITEFETIKKVVTAIRSLKKRYNIKEKENLNIVLKSGVAFNDVLMQRKLLLKQLAKATLTEQAEEKPKNKEGDFYSTLLGDDFEIFVNIGSFIDLDLEKKRLNKALEKIEKNIAITERKLENKKFIDNAKIELVEKEKQSHQQLKNQKEELLKELKNLG